MASTYTQLVRNLACVLKAFLPENHVAKSMAFPKAPAPLNKVKQIEFFIAITQFGAVCFNIISSYFDTIQGFREQRRSSKYLIGLDKLSIEAGNGNSMEYTLLRHSLQRDNQNGWIKFYIGFCEFFIGCSFMFLMANSLHLHGPTHPKPLIDALLVMEIALAYILLVMWRSFVGKLVNVLKTRNLARKLETLPLASITPKKIAEIAADSGYLSNMIDICALLDPSFSCSYTYSISMQGGLKEDLARVHTLLSPDNTPTSSTSSTDLKRLDSEPYLTPEAVNIFDILTPRYGVRSRQKKGGVAATSSLPSLSIDSSARTSFYTFEEINYLVQSLYSKSIYHTYEAILEFSLFSLNVLAGYGYLLGILAFYFPNASLESNNVGEYMAKVLMFNYSNEEADWGGNLLGDVAWTIEPLLTIFSPLMVKIFMKAFDRPRAGMKQN